MSDPMVLRARVAAPAKNVHHALTDAGALQAWLAEHAEVELPDRFAFWGRYTPEGDAPHQRLLHADDHSLSFSWLLGGVDTTVEIGWEAEDADSTIVTLSQSDFDAEAMMTGANIRGVLQTYWALTIANLADYVEGRELTPKCDFSTPVQAGEVLIAAPRDVVYDSLVTSEKASQWFGFPIGIEPWVGGRFAMGGLDAGFAANIVALEPGRKMSIDWGPTGISTWELEDSDGQTRLTFVQSGFDENQPPHSAWLGWLSGVAELRRFNELADWRPLWLQDS